MIGITLTAVSGVKYTTVSEIGSGGFGSVFLAHDEAGKEFALKLIAPAVDPAAVSSFRQEIESTSGLDHPNILRVIDWGQGTIKGQPALFIISEICSDGDYRSVVSSYASNGFPIDVILGDFTQILSGLAVLHSKVIHRDIKPENVLQAGAVLKIGDYGLAKFVDEATRTLTFKGGGTPRYVAPEVWRNKSATPATDLYAIGVMLFEALTGKPPYAETDLLRLRNEHLYAAVPRPKSINPNVPDYLDGIVKKLLAKAFADRYQSANEVLEALSKVGGSEPSAVVREIAAQARQHHDLEEARSLELLKNLTAAEEETKKNLFARHELLSLFEDAVAEINSQLPETKLTRADSFSETAGRAWQFGPRIALIWFFDRHEMFGGLDAGLIALLRSKNIADGGYIKITENGRDREGWNIVQVRPADAAYGEWRLIETRTSPLVQRPQKIEPFAADAALLAENLAFHWKPTMHVYQLSDKQLERSDIFRILGLLVSKA
jgi:serine/threonine protein kinase